MTNTTPRSWLFDTNNGSSIGIDGPSGRITVTGSAAFSNIGVQSLSSAATGETIISSSGTIDAKYLTGVIADTSILPPIPCSKLYGQLLTSSFAPGSIPAAAIIGGGSSTTVGSVSNLTFSNATSGASASLSIDPSGNIDLVATSLVVQSGGFQISSGPATFGGSTAFGGPTAFNGPVSFNNSSVNGIGQAVQSFLSNSTVPSISFSSPDSPSSSTTLSVEAGTGRLKCSSGIDIYGLIYVNGQLFQSGGGNSTWSNVYQQSGGPLSSTSIAFTASSVPASAVSFAANSVPASAVSFTASSVPASAVSFTPNSVPASAVYFTASSVPASAVSFTPNSVPSTAVSFTPNSVPFSAISNLGPSISPFLTLYLTGPTSPIASIISASVGSNVQSQSLTLSNASGSSLTLTAGAGPSLYVNGAPMSSSSISFAVNSVPVAAVSNISGFVASSIQSNVQIVADYLAGNTVDVQSLVLSNALTLGVGGNGQLAVNGAPMSSSSISFANASVPVAAVSFVASSVPNSALQVPNPWTAATAGSSWIYTYSNVSIGSSTMDNADFSLQVNGVICANTDLVVLSDARLKEDREAIVGALDKIRRINGMTYTRKDAADSKKRRYAGVLAQDVEAVLPEAVHYSGDMRAVAYPSLLALVIEAIKELDDKIQQNFA